jgi:hypothetical protein
MSCNVPLAVFIFVSPNGFVAIMSEACINGSGHEQVGDVLKLRLIALGTINIDAISGVIIDLLKELKLIHELKMCSESSI